MSRYFSEIFLVFSGNFPATSWVSPTNVVRIRDIVRRRKTGLMWTSAPTKKSRASQNFPRMRKTKSNRFRPRRVRGRKHFSGCKCGICSLANKLCAQQTARIHQEIQKGFPDEKSPRTNPGALLCSLMPQTRLDYMSKGSMPRTGWPTSDR